MASSLFSPAHSLSRTELRILWDGLCSTGFQIQLEVLDFTPSPAISAFCFAAMKN